MDAGKPRTQVLSAEDHAEYWRLVIVRHGGANDHHFLLGIRETGRVPSFTWEVSGSPQIIIPMPLTMKGGEPLCHCSEGMICLS